MQKGLAKTTEWAAHSVWIQTHRPHDSGREVYFKTIQKPHNRAFGKM